MGSQMGVQPGLAQLMRSEKYSDLKLICQGREFRVHKAIVCTQSSVLAAACDGGFQEATSNIIHITEFDPETVERMVSFMYTTDYDSGTIGSIMIQSPTLADTEKAMTDGPPATSKLPKAETNYDERVIASASIKTLNEAPETALIDFTKFSQVENSRATLPIEINVMLHHVRVNAIADYYDLSSLTQLANQKMSELFTCNRSVNHFAAVIEEAFKITPDTDLHDMITTQTAAHIKKLIDRPEFIAMELMNDFAIGVIREMIRQHKVEVDKINFELRAIMSHVVHKLSALNR